MCRCIRVCVWVWMQVKARVSRSPGAGVQACDEPSLQSQDNFNQSKAVTQISQEHTIKSDSGPLEWRHPRPVLPEASLYGGKEGGAGFFFFSLCERFACLYVCLSCVCLVPVETRREQRSWFLRDVVWVGLFWLMAYNYVSCCSLHPPLSMLRPTLIIRTDNARA